ncbi:disulfide bond formation protein B [Quisquiliibacterium transsilvanicum]|uniref:Disulfide bond formation protein DsbB n=1 Tax=Quisquiliibacterium transsilvanicum TaxID=1549638 RepID=A0A7W8HG38_9BURK|nr:disulfide bond formation protein B [Quisquiliibacterium transsilvanicum]MBB5270831.1 disulfide bond formation protein DsbB [Quisquiliibacterium transsilvanicum]
MPDRDQGGAARLLAACACFCAAALALGQVAQHAFDMQPCAWCVLQRLIFLLAGISCALGAWVLRSRAGRLVAALTADLLVSAGLAAALYQHFVASRTDSCALTLADRLVMALSLPELAPSMFLATASCAEANLPLLGIPFALWSAAAFLLLAAALGLALVRLLRGGGQGPG